MPRSILLQTFPSYRKLEKGTGFQQAIIIFGMDSSLRFLTLIPLEFTWKDKWDRKVRLTYCLYWKRIKETMYKSQCYESFLPFWHLSYWWNYKTAQFIDECIEYILFWRFFAIQLRVNDLFAMTTFFWQNNCNKIYIDANFVRIKIQESKSKNVEYIMKKM